MIDHLIRDLQVLRKADFLIGKIWLSVMARRFGLFAFAVLIAVFGLGMANLAGFYALQGPLGPIWASVLVAVADLGIAALVVLVASNTSPGREIDLAMEVRNMAIESLQVDARELKAILDTVGQEVMSVKETLTSLVQNPLDAAAQKLLIPAALSIIRGLRSKREHT